MREARTTIKVLRERKSQFALFFLFRNILYEFCKGEDIRGAGIFKDILIELLA